MRAVWLSALAILIADQASKLYVLRVLDLAEVGRVEVLPPYLVFQMLWNRGINFGLFAGGAEALRWGLVALALVISAAVFI
jgi:Lipoprotein signal peptidase